MGPCEESLGIITTVSNDGAHPLDCRAGLVPQASHGAQPVHH